MNEKIKNELERLQNEVRDASSELSDAANEYEKRRKVAQVKLTHASGQLTMIVTMMQKGPDQR